MRAVGPPAVRLTDSIEKLTVEIAATGQAVGPVVGAETNTELRQLWAGFDDARRRAVYDQGIERIVVLPPKPGVARLDSDRLQVRVRF
ncbi:hypothetical protein [Geodermatophilus sabuli]|uniref:Uncharacterized protein n=1 Tax=Geodermatophilus sabuli TaxID=1564158 RepID=A0A285EBP4_9ACTN|nr:hypothetical protein [Geodermatophilus sabuli]MBB3084179.1 hypothetical protein [Geodermatophilus sabuli]SNX96548.1 hypothetical protein SAMN06893097_104263 [Geodermatophilus sabuli]